MLKFLKFKEKPKLDPKREFQRQIVEDMEKYTKKCDFNGEQVGFITKLSMKMKIRPERIIETISLNATKTKTEVNSTKKNDTKKSIKIGYKWEINDYTLNKYYNKINEYERIVKKEQGYKKGHYKERLKRYENIVEILYSVKDKDELIQKTAEKSGFKPLDF